MTSSPRCDCGSNLDLRDIAIDSASGPPRLVTFCGLCAPAATGPVSDSVAWVLAAGLVSPSLESLEASTPEPPWRCTPP